MSKDPVQAPEKESPRYTAPALEKGLDILELLVDAPEGETLNEIARKLNRSVSEIFRMVITLERRGYLCVGENDRFGLSLKFLELAHRHMPLRSLVNTALPLMRELANRSRQSCHLTVYQGGRVVVIAQVDSPERWSFGLKVGATIGLLDTASGHVLLAYRDEAEIERMIGQHVLVEGESVLAMKALQQELDTVRKQGLAVTCSRQIRGVTNIAGPVFGVAGQLLACLNIPYIERVDAISPPQIETVKASLSEATQKLSALMGYSGHDGGDSPS